MQYNYTCRCTYHPSFHDEFNKIFLSFDENARFWDVNYLGFKQVDFKINGNDVNALKVFLSKNKVVKDYGKSISDIKLSYLPEVEDENLKYLEHVLRNLNESQYEIIKNKNEITIEFNNISYNSYEALKSRVYYESLTLTSSSFPELIDFKVSFGVGSDFEVEADDYQHAPFVKISDTKTISGIEEGDYKFNGNELHVIKKRLGNFKHFQTNLIGGQGFIFAKKSFLSFIDKYDIKGLSFKPVKVMSLTGESKDSRSIFWAIPQLEYKEDITVCGIWGEDKFRQSLPLTLKREYQEEMSQVDFFEARALFGTCLSQKAYQALLSENMTDDIVSVTYCDIGLYSSEPTKKLKEKLIANNCFDYELEEKFGEL